MRRTILTLSTIVLVPAFVAAQDTTGQQGQQGTTSAATQQDSTHSDSTAKTASAKRHHKRHSKATRSKGTATSHGGVTGSDSAKANQTKSGVTNAKTGKSTLGRNIKKTRPDQGQAVTSKGDTLRHGGDTTGTTRPPQ
jgi:hypothetical protein